jgi:signal transduction histidine kinase
VQDDAARSRGAEKSMTGRTGHPPSDEPKSPTQSPSLPVSSVFRAILGDSSLPMAATEGETHLVRYANAAFCRLVGHGDEAVRGHPLHGILEVAGLGDTVALLDRVFSAGGAASVAVFHEGGVQPAMHATYAAWRVPAEHERPAGLLVQVMDMSDQVRAAEELSEINRRLLQAGLDAEVRAETHVTLNAALQERERRLQVALEEQARLLVSEQVAHDRAEAALRVRDEFLATAAHELRSPLAAIRGTAQLARRAVDRGTLDATQAQRHLDNIVASTGRLEALLTDLLDVSRMRVQGLSASLAWMDLAALADTVVRRYREIAERTGIVCDVPQQPVVVRGDAGRLEQVLDNLLSNAVKYSPAGGEVVLELRIVTGGVELTVRDSGIGLPPGAEERIFEPFRRAPNAVTHGVTGIGLGLHISRQIAEAHGGTLRAESQGEGLGSTITLWLPQANNASHDL